MANNNEELNKLYAEGLKNKIGQRERLKQTAPSLPVYSLTLKLINCGTKVKAK